MFQAIKPIFNLWKEAYYKWRQWGLDPFAPEQAELIIKRATIRGIWK